MAPDCVERKLAAILIADVVGYPIPFLAALEVKWKGRLYILISDQGGNVSNQLAQAVNHALAVPTLLEKKSSQLAIARNFESFP